MRYLLGLLALVSFSAFAATGTAMLPDGVDYDPAVPAPESVLGYPVGAQHVRHDQLVAYFRELARTSDRVRLEQIGRTPENRPQVMAVISSPDNLARLEAIRERHLAVASGDAEPGDGPAIIWQGYSIHGDEASGSNAALLYAYHLAAARDAETRAALDEVVVLLDPSLNPDGLARYAAWATQRMSAGPVTDPAHREHHQPWPGGRGSHYWFDLNRDWLLLQHPESRNRVAVLQQWRPHVVTDHHEMGHEATYFFQPGVPERTHPLTPARNQELTGLIAEFHAEYLDREGQLYYSRESYDDFYYGKGSTYPDINGGVGILFEQAGSEGQGIETPYGIRYLADGVHNHLITSFSTLAAARELAPRLKAYQAGFFEAARERAGDADFDAWVIGDGGNPARLRAFLEVLAGHGIRVRALEESVEAGGTTYRPGHAWVVPLEQQQYRLIEALFERRTEFPSNVFYDVSAWSLPLAFDLPHAPLGSVPDSGEATLEPGVLSADFSADPGAVAYAFDWSSDAAPATLQALQESGVKTLAATEPFTLGTPAGEVELGRGAIVVPLGIQPDRRGGIETILERQAGDSGLDVHAAATGLTSKGVDLGSPSLVPLKPVKPLLVTGRGISPYEAGEVWHLADTRLGLPVTQVEQSRLGEVALADYTHVILVGGEYARLGWYAPGQGESVAARLHQWVAGGGTLVAQKEAAQWVTDFRLALQPPERQVALEEAGGDFADEVQKASLEEDTQPEGARDYADFEQDFAARLISGTIFETALDTTHPLGYGFPDGTLPVFRDGLGFLEASDNPYETVARYTEEPLMAGYASDARRQEVAGTAAVIANRVGEGLVVRLADNPNFRAVWHGTSRLMVNALYLSGAVGNTQMPR